MDIDENVMALDEKEGGQEDGMEEGADEMEEDLTDKPEEESTQEPKTEENESGGEEEAEKVESAEKDVKEDTEDNKQEVARDEDLAHPNDKEHKQNVRMSKIKTAHCIEYGSFPHMFLVLFKCWGSVSRSRRWKMEQERMKNSQSQLREKSTAQIVRLANRIFRVIRLWSWQEKPRRETKPKRLLTVINCCTKACDRVMLMIMLKKLTQENRSCLLCIFVFIIPK